MPNRMFVHAATSEGYVHNDFKRPFTLRLRMSCSKRRASPGIEHRMLQHTYIIKTVCDIFDLKGSLNRRDQSAQSFADLFEKADQTRWGDDMPKKLDRAPIEDNVESVVAGVPVHPGNEPLDELTKEWSAGMSSLLGSGLESVEAAAVPTTQGAAADAVQASLKAAGL